MLKTCKNGHEYDPQITTYCPKCPIEGLDTSALGPRYRRSESQREGAAPPVAEVRAGPAPAAPRQRKTVAIWPSAATAAAKRDERVDPVVGWLVAHLGPALGRDFRIRWGNNSIGRGPGQSISISDDEQIHTENHAFIIYDPDSNRFVLTRGLGRGLVHVNGVLVTGEIDLRPYSEIKLGGSHLTFVPLCFVDDVQKIGFVWDFDSVEKGPAK